MSIRFGRIFACYNASLGFFCTSGIERLPTEKAIRKQVQNFKGLELAK